jgi:hypothetical protein
MAELRACKRGHVGGRYKSGACIECMAMRKGRKGRSVPPTRLDKLDKETVLLATAEARAKKSQARADRKRAIADHQEQVNRARDANLEHFSLNEAEKAVKRRLASREGLQRFLQSREAGPTTGTLNIQQVADQSRQKALAEKAAFDRKPMTRVEEMRAKYVRHHQRLQEPWLGPPDQDPARNSGAPQWADVGGVVQFNASREGGVDERTRKLRLLDF